MIKILKKFTNYYNKKRKIVFQLKKKSQIYHFNIKLYFIKAKKITISYKLGYSKIQKYILYFINCY